MRMGARLDKLERAVQIQKNELMAAAYVVNEICTGLSRCREALDPATYKRVQTVLRSGVEEAHPWLASRRA